MKQTKDGGGGSGDDGITDIELRECVILHKFPR